MQCFKDTTVFLCSRRVFLRLPMCPWATLDASSNIRVRNFQARNFSPVAEAFLGSSPAQTAPHLQPWRTTGCGRSSLGRHGVLHWGGALHSLGWTGIRGGTTVGRRLVEQGNQGIRQDILWRSRCEVGCHIIPPFRIIGRDDSTGGESTHTQALPVKSTFSVITQMPKTKHENE